MAGIRQRHGSGCKRPVSGCKCPWQAEVYSARDKKKIRKLFPTKAAANGCSATGDGGLTDAEQSTLENCPHVRVVTIPGKAFSLPNERPDRIAQIIAEALGRDAGHNQPE